ncbi:3-hydroxyacyl-CoA dehydrogenase NAD-binding domain-containing protein [Sporichthya sp.]|uniref:3-hydroxyacyl-CoA dehydrogenase NAD-binding domain-containing protein n=1 Tax=Sporichthya sp. TaxID=65475 RepID=UPI0017B04A27|nr:3-hydroxyacyl-CoA dehydrogenase NAD-binding domain-containing protein [Sporichthya sp.]MBA3744506.1 enoyl-CoA hydratase/isomerase family protein [Sporichthya sp.]
MTLQDTIGTFKVSKDEDNIVTLTMDDPAGSANTMSEAFQTSLGQLADALEAEIKADKASISGIVLTSAKKTFFAGGNLGEILGASSDGAAAWTAEVNTMKRNMRRLELLPVPKVAAINGAALGGGYEMCLIMNRRIALDARGSQIGLPEVGLGLLPGAGGVVRSTRLLGIQDALLNVLLQGQRYSPAQALEKGMVDEVVATPEEMLANAKTWIKENPKAVQPWDVKGFKIPGGAPNNPAFAANLPAFPANLRKQLKGAPMPAPRNIMAAAIEGAQVDLDTALAIETQYFIDIATGQVAKNMITAFFFDMQYVNSGGARPKGYDAYKAKKVAVLGAGMMGAGIAYVCAQAGIEVVLKDVTLDAAEKGKAYSAKLVGKQVSRGKLSQDDAAAFLARITPTGDAADVAGADLVIEAVFESVELKHKVFGEIEGHLTPDALLGSNTSSLPITALAKGVSRPEDFIGLHFFSPVDKMPLLEIIAGAQTSDATLAKALDLAKQIKKTPIVVNDSPGFFTSRVIGTYINECLAMVGEGVDPQSIEQACLQAGYPVGALALSDELTLTLMRKIREANKDNTVLGGQGHPADGVVDRMIDDYHRPSRAAGKGFYEYENGEKAGLWPGLREHFGTGLEPVIGSAGILELQERMLFIESIETMRCFDEGVLRSESEANIGSIMGIGFPPWTGGVVQYIKGYTNAAGEVGPAAFVARADELTVNYGVRFTPPTSLVEASKDGKVRLDG